jgi:hypothetical protein
MNPLYMVVKKSGPDYYQWASLKRFANIAEIRFL